MSDIVLAMTGASGAQYGVRLLHVLLSAGRTVHLTISPTAVQVLQCELGLSVDLEHFDPASLLTHDLAEGAPSRSPGGSSIFSDSDVGSARVVYHHYQDYSAGIASGSFRTGGMVICPCSMGTLAAIAGGLSTNLIHRAADVHLKERRKLIVVPRETPLGTIPLGNMLKLSKAGAVVLPASPGFYHGATAIRDLIDFVVARICDQLGVPVDLMRRWGEQ